MFIDTHLHLSEDFGVQPDLYVEHSLEAGVKVLIASFCEKDDLLLSTKYVKKYDCVYASVGYHPEVADKIVEEDFALLEKLVKENKKIVAIGEIGLDYHWNKENKEIQRRVFQKQLEIAEKLNIPVIIHSREAIGETYEILSQFHVRGVIHCFSGSLEMAQKFIHLGFLLGIGGVVTFSNSNLYQVIEKIGLDSLVLETDSPYLAPVPHRGEVNESKYIPLIAAKLSEILDLPISEVEKITTKNASGLFDLPSNL